LMSRMLKVNVSERITAHEVFWRLSRLSATVGSMTIELIPARRNELLIALMRVTNECQQSMRICRMIFMIRLGWGRTVIK
jgi:hypothetical protein